MVSVRRTTRKLSTHLVLLAFCARALVPAGCMPGGDEGWYLQLCPEGMTQEAMATLLGSHHFHHHDADVATASCELGGFSWVSLTSGRTENETEPGAARSPAIHPPHAAAFARVANVNRSRAPPIT